MTLSKVVGDLQLGDKKVTLNHLVYVCFFLVTMLIDCPTGQGFCSRFWALKRLGFPKRSLYIWD